MMMPRYFFNVSLEEHLLPDPEGQELPDPDAAWERARRIALDRAGWDERGRGRAGELARLPCER